MKRRSGPLTFLSFALILAACGPRAEVRLRPVSLPAREAPAAAREGPAAQWTLRPDQVARIQEICGPFGMPRKAVAFGATHLVVREGYVLEHSDADRIPLWVAQHLVGAALVPVQGYRRPRWKPDPELPPAARAEDADYAGWEDVYDRGHMAPSGDYSTEPARDQTFFLSNAVPQAARGNQGLWVQLETRVRNWTKARSEAFVVTGAFFYDPDAEGQLEHAVIGKNGVSVPTHLFKIVLAPKKDAHGWEAIAFVAENRAYESPYPYQGLVRSIDWIEERTGLDFFPSLSSDPALEHAIEGAAAPLWD